MLSFHGYRLFLPTPSPNPETIPLPPSMPDPKLGSRETTAGALRRAGSARRPWGRGLQDGRGLPVQGLCGAGLSGFEAWIKGSQTAV